MYSRTEATQLSGKSPRFVSGDKHASGSARIEEKIEPIKKKKRKTKILVGGFEEEMEMGRERERQ